MMISTHEYSKEVASIVDACKADCRGLNAEWVHDWLHAAVDGHQWVVDDAFHADVLLHSDNAEYGLDEGLVAWRAGTDCPPAQLHVQLAFWAMHQDVTVALDGWDPKA